MKVDFMDPRIKEQDMKLDEIHNHLIKIRIDIKRYLDRLVEIRDSSRDNASISGSISKQIHIYDSNSEFSSKSDQYSLELFFDTIKPILDKNILIFENLSKLNEDYLFYISHLYDDITEAINTIERLKEYKNECLAQINSIVS